MSAAINIDGIYIIICSIMTYFFGLFLVNNVASLKRYNIPEGVIGSIPVCILFYCIRRIYDIEIIFGMELRDFFLLFFFCTVGMLADLKEILRGGGKLILLVIAMGLFIFCQDAIGILVAKLLGVPLVHGLIAGSISLAGGHGTAISWGKYLEQAGYEGALELGVIAATIGLVGGGLIGGSVGSALIEKWKLIARKKRSGFKTNESKTEFFKFISSTDLFLICIVYIMVAIAIGIEMNKGLNAIGLFLPEYVPAIFAGILLINLNKLSGNKIRINSKKLELLNGISLQIFITMSMLSIDIGHLINYKILNIFVIILIQAVFVFFFAKYVFFRIAGKTYDSAILTSGFVGAGLGATPVGLANIAVITKKYKLPSTEALILLPLVASIFTDLMNAGILKFFLSLIT